MSLEMDSADSGETAPMVRLLLSFYLGNGDSIKSSGRSSICDKRIDRSLIGQYFLSRG